MVKHVHTASDLIGLVLLCAVGRNGPGNPWVLGSWFLERR